MAGPARGRRPPNASSPDIIRIYLDQIGKHPVLTKAEEVHLAQQIEVGVEAAAELEGNPTPKEARDLELLVAQGERARKVFIECNLRLVVSVAKKYKVDRPLQDLIQDGAFGVIRAVEKFDWRMGWKFSTYATWWIRQAIERQNDASDLIRLPNHVAEQRRHALQIWYDLMGKNGQSIEAVATEMGITTDKALLLLNYQGVLSLDSDIPGAEDISLSDVIADPASEDAFDKAASISAMGIETLLSPLSTQERRILRRRLNLDDQERPATLLELGAEMGLTKARIQQIEAKATSKLRHPANRRTSGSLIRRTSEVD